MCQLYARHSTMCFYLLHHAFIGLCLLITPDAQISIADSALGQHCCGFLYNEAYAAHSSAHIMLHVPVGREAVHGRVHTHGREYDAVAYLNALKCYGCKK